MTKKKSPEVYVFFDTNALYTKVASDLFNNAVAELIKTESNRTDINVTWYLPEIVVDERKYQMQKVANELLPYLEKLEKLLGHKLGITRDILIKRIDDCVSEYVENYTVEVIKLDATKVDLKSIIHRSCFRLAPFSAGDQEKGFRDSMIAETFFQFICSLPKSTNNCKIIFVTQDGDLKNHIEVETKNRKNVAVLGNVEDLVGQINTLASEVDEETIKVYQELAKRYFFDSKNKAGLFYKESLREIISEKFKSDLLLCPEGVRQKRENSTWYISDPQFIKKSRSRVCWVTRVDVTCEVFKEEIEQQSPFLSYDNNQPISSGSLTSLFNNNNFLKINHSPPATGILSSLLTKKTLVSRGKTQFEVQWSVNINNHNKLTRASVDDTRCLGTIWEDA